MQSYDVVVVGAGPSGCSTAINCANLGMDVLLLEKKRIGERKPCGGVLPWITSEVIEDILGVEIPSKVMSDPRELGLYYVPPSGKDDGGAVPNYRIHNIARQKFDAWLIEVAQDSGVDILAEARFVSFEDNTSRILRTLHNDEDLFIEADFVVGADGVHSAVRKAHSLNDATDFMIVGQERWANRSHSDLGDYFYGFFRGDISISYAYAIPKGDNLLIGTGVRRRKAPHVFAALDKFRKWLVTDFNFDDSSLFNREVWEIPFGYSIPGKGNTLLVGDAAGLCNPLSGEGIRLGIESGESAALAISQARKGSNLVESYCRETDGIVRMVRSIYDFVITADDVTRQQFVINELKRGLV